MCHRETRSSSLQAARALSEPAGSSYVAVTLFSSRRIFGSSNIMKAKHHLRRQLLHWLPSKRLIHLLSYIHYLSCYELLNLLEPLLLVLWHVVNFLPEDPRRSKPIMVHWRRIFTTKLPFSWQWPLPSISWCRIVGPMEPWIRPLDCCWVDVFPFILGWAWIMLVSLFWILHSFVPNIIPWYSHTILPLTKSLLFFLLLSYYSDRLCSQAFQESARSDTFRQCRSRCRHSSWSEPYCRFGWRY